MAGQVLCLYLYLITELYYCMKEFLINTHFKLKGNALKNNELIIQRYIFIPSDGIVRILH